MKKISLGLLACVSVLMLFSIGCGKTAKNDNGLSDFAKSNFSKHSDFIKHMESSGLSVGVDLSKKIFVAVPEVLSSDPDCCLVISALSKYSQFINTKVETKGKATVSSSSLSISDLKIIGITEEVAETLSEKIMLLHKGKVVYEELIQNDARKVKTDLTVKQLLELLEKNNLKVNVTAYCRTTTEKSALIVLKIPQKNQQ